MSMSSPDVDEGQLTLRLWACLGCPDNGQGAPGSTWKTTQELNSRKEH